MKAHNVGAYSKTNRLGSLDGRTAEGKLYREFREELIDHCGGNPNIIQAALIAQCARIKLRITLMDEKMQRNLTEHDSRTYLAWANTLSRLLMRLGINPAAAAPKETAVAYTRRLGGDGIEGRKVR
jgi:hypothetical protein